LKEKDRLLNFCWESKLHIASQQTIEDYTIEINAISNPSQYHLGFKKCLQSHLLC